MAIRIPEQPARPLGTAVTSYPIEVVYDTWRICADTPEEIVALLIDGYADHLDEHDRLQARIGFASRAQNMVQTLLNAGELFDQSTDEEAQILLRRSDAPPAVAEWGGAIPLVLVTVFYQPTGPLPQPRTTAAGQIWWIDPSTAQSLLEALHQVRLLDLMVTGSPAVWEDRRTAYPNLGTNGAAGYRWRSVGRSEP